MRRKPPTFAAKAARGGARCARADRGDLADEPLTLGIFWLGQQTQLDACAAQNRTSDWLHFMFLAVVTVLPFSTRLLADFIDYPRRLSVYCANILLCGAALYLAGAHVERAGLHRAEAPADAWLGDPPPHRQRTGALRRRRRRRPRPPAARRRPHHPVQLNYAIAPRWTNWS